MRVLTDIQKEFLLTQFFKNEDYPGWKDIAIKLLEQGTCVVAGDTCIWKGGVGNFIKTNDDGYFVGCLKYKFNLKEFMESEYFDEIITHYTTNVLEEKKAIEEKFRDLNLLRI